MPAPARAPLLALVLALAGTSRASRAPRGWNNFDAGPVDEAGLLVAAAWLRDNLLAFGYDTLCVDGGWNINGSSFTIDAFGRPYPRLDLFPSAADGRGFASFAAKIHGMGLKLGVWIHRGMDDTTYAMFKGLIDRPHGIFLVTGPTGSGKTTTLYAALNAIVGSTIKVLTVEDPVEYHLHGVNQIPVNHQVGMTFEKGLRAILRHDPDVVMIGEIRDLETARAATQAAMTGHLVLSTLHTNDSASAAMRLIEMGVEPFLVSSTMIGAMAQRLVRRICSKCKEEYEPDPATLPRDLILEPGAKLARGKGCPHCRNTGFRGRSGLYELMVMTDVIAELIIDRAPSPKIVAAARPSGLRLLREDGWIKVRQGLTTPDEVVQCTAL